MTYNDPRNIYSSWSGPSTYVSDGIQWQITPPPAEPKTVRYPFVHHCIAHPLLFIWPRLGVWLHDKTEY